MAITAASKAHHQPASDETTPLLVASEAGPTIQANEVTTARVDRSGEDEHLDGDDEGDTDEGPPLPKVQILLLCYARLVEPIAFFSIFPFINQMIADTGNVAASDVGFYSGLIESLFSLTQMILMIPWGRLADRVGRKPVLVLSLCGLTVSSTVFGLSKSLWQMIVFRCLAGVFAGSIVTIRVMISEHSTPKTQARAFSFFSLFGNLGIFLGPLIGGALANPVEEYPSVFGGNKLFKEYPYLLAAMCTGAISASAAIVSILFIKEKQKSKEMKQSSNTAPMSTWELLRSPGVPMVLYIYNHAMLLGLAFTAVDPVFLFTPVKLGGLELTPLQIAAFMGAGGAFQAIWGVGIFPPLQRKIGTGGILRQASWMWPVGFAIFPLCNLFLKQHWIGAFWAGLIFVTAIWPEVSMAFTAVQLALNDISPSPSTLGTLNAIALALSSGMRAVAPALFSSIYASGVRKQIVDGYLAWIILILLVIPFGVAVRWLPEKAEGRIKSSPRSR